MKPFLALAICLFSSMSWADGHTRIMVGGGRTINCGLFVAVHVEHFPLPSKECNGHFEFVDYFDRLYVWNETTKKYEFDSYLNYESTTFPSEQLASRVAGHRLGIREFRYGVR